MTSSVYTHIPTHLRAYTHTHTQSIPRQTNTRWLSVLADGWILGTSGVQRCPPAIVPTSISTGRINKKVHQLGKLFKNRHIGAQINGKPTQQRIPLLMEQTDQHARAELCGNVHLHWFYLCARFYQRNVNERITRCLRRRYNKSATITHPVVTCVIVI